MKLSKFILFFTFCAIVLLLINVLIDLIVNNNEPSSNITSLPLLHVALFATPLYTILAIHYIRDSRKVEKLILRLLYPCAALSLVGILGASFFMYIVSNYYRGNYSSDGFGLMVIIYTIASIGLAAFLIFFISGLLRHFIKKLQTISINPLFVKMSVIFILLGILCVGITTLLSQIR